MSLTKEGYSLFPVDEIRKDCETHGILKETTVNACGLQHTRV